MKTAAVLWPLLIFGACQQPAVGPDTQQVSGETVVLAPGQEVRVGGLLHVWFGEVLSDSRCPTDVVCVWAGNAEVQIGLALGTGPTHPFRLNTTLQPASADFGGYRVTLVALTPAPVSTRLIDPAEYRAHLKVETIPDPSSDPT
ncbi:MAG: hypothetical protein OER21_03770 [Gemmatimonadota bacterium]|nr:hypothetical protein [Gemmatimonadota bacterium]